MNLTNLEYKNETTYCEQRPVTQWYEQVKVIRKQWKSPGKETDCKKLLNYDFVTGSRPSAIARVLFPGVPNPRLGWCSYDEQLKTNVSRSIMEWKCNKTGQGTQLVEQWGSIWSMSIFSQFRYMARTSWYFTWDGKVFAVLPSVNDKATSLREKENKIVPWWKCEKVYDCSTRPSIKKCLLIYITLVSISSSFRDFGNTMIPRHWHLTVIDLKDCFFSIPLHPDDAPKFAFSIPNVNMQAPLQRYQRVVLPQGVKNSPTMCQWYVAKILSPVRNAMPTVLLYHYMDDLLVAAQHHEVMEKAVALVTDAVNSAGLCIAPEKIQKFPPWKYLGWRIRAQTIVPQPLQINTNVRNLHDAQKLLGTINWVRPLLGISNTDLNPLFELLKGDTNLCSPRNLNPEADTSLQKVASAIASRQAHPWAPELPFYLIILNPARQPHALIFQWDLQNSDPLLIIEWIFLPNQSTKTILTQHEMFASLIVKARSRLLTLSGKDFVYNNPLIVRHFAANGSFEAQVKAQYWFEIQKQSDVRNRTLQLEESYKAGKIHQASEQDLTDLFKPPPRLQGQDVDSDGTLTPPDSPISSRTGKKTTLAVVQAPLREAVGPDSGAVILKVPFSTKDLGEWKKGPTESPSKFLDRLRDTMRHSTPLDPGSEVRIQQFVSLFLDQSTADIRRKLQKLRTTEKWSKDPAHLDSAAARIQEQSYYFRQPTCKGLRILGNPVRRGKIVAVCGRYPNHYQDRRRLDDVDASFLSGNTGEPVHHNCLETIEATYASRPDLKDSPIEKEENWFTDRSSYVLNSNRHAGYTITTSEEIIESGALPMNTSAQKLIALTRALELGQEKTLEPQWEGLFQVLLTSFTAIQIKEQNPWIHHTRVKKAPSKWTSESDGKLKI
ncbi:uncharacterized protein LOC129734621 [Falco cherrug]|uniref:uncharacterized protein LOC129734621 n=1 Tax=Falco cherrug TaxID=345164 RepID=UPI00247B1B86|nr:uncharacterized protein LOC129734621 [Falco cherrug]